MISGHIRTTLEACSIQYGVAFAFRLQANVTLICKSLTHYAGAGHAWRVSFTLRLQGSSTPVP